MNPNEQDTRIIHHVGSFLCVAHTKDSWPQAFSTQVNQPISSLRQSMTTPVLILPFLDVPFDYEKTRRPRVTMPTKSRPTNHRVYSSSSSDSGGEDSLSVSSGSYSFDDDDQISVYSSSSSDSCYWSYDEATRPRLGPRYQVELEKFFEGL
jgi:hypothetical protein